MIRTVDSGEHIIVYDPVWASTGILITDSKLVRLLHSTSVNNLKYLSQNGSSNFIKTPFGKKSKITRYDHSVGCMVLALRVATRIDELAIDNAIVALLHDVMHLPFSHTIDHLLGTESESYHETHKTELLEKYAEEFIDILGSDWKKYFKEENFPTVKLNNPFAIDVCDYTARDLYHIGFIDDKIVQKCLLFTTVEDGYLKCSNDKTVKLWKKLSKMINDNMYTAAWNMADNHYFSESIREIMDAGEVSKEEIINYSADTEKKIYDKIKHIFSKKVKGKKFLLLIADSYDHSIYTKIKSMRVRYRYMNPTLIGEMPKKSDGLFVNLDLVYY